MVPLTNRVTTCMPDTLGPQCQGLLTGGQGDLSDGPSSVSPVTLDKSVSLSDSQFASSLSRRRENTAFQACVLCSNMTVEKEWHIVTDFSPQFPMQ